MWRIYVKEKSATVKPSSNHANNKQLYTDKSQRLGTAEDASKYA